jgi:hypothetical protein
MSPTETVKDEVEVETVEEVLNQEQALPTIMDLETFINVHRNQLESSGVPEVFWASLYRKLANSVSINAVKASLILHFCIYCVTLGVNTSIFCLRE